MLDKERVLIKIDELHGYLKEIRQIIPDNFDDYLRIEKKRSCERLLQLSVECLIDICKKIVAGLRLGLPSEENDLFNKLFKNGIIDKKKYDMLIEMRGFRNVLVHEYASVDNELVFKILQTRINDFEELIKAILKFIKAQ